MAVAPGVDLQDLQPEARNAFYAAMAEMDKAGIPYTVTSGVRTRDQQAALYSAYQARGYTGLPAAPPGSSKHEVGDAVDVSVDPAHRGAVTDIMQKHGLQWFGPGDHVHYTYAGPSAKAAGDLSFLSTGAQQPPQHDLSFLKTAVAAPKAKAAPAPDLSFLSTPKPVAAPKSVDLSFLNTGQAEAPLPQLGTPGNPRRSSGSTLTPEATAALSYPRHGSTGGNAPLQTTLPAIEAEHQNISQGAAPVEKATWGPIQRGLNVAWGVTGGTAASRFLNEATKQVAKRVAAGDSMAAIPGAPGYIGAHIDAAKAIPWGKLLMQSLRGDTAEFPQPFKAIGEGAPDTGVGRLIAKNPVPTAALDFLVSFPITAAMGEVQNEVAGRLGQGLAAGAEASGIAPAGRRLLNRVPEPVRRLAGVDPIGNAASEIVNKSLAGWSHSLRDAQQVEEDMSATSQRYRRAGTNIKTVSPITNQPVNKLDALVADYMDAGNPGSKHEVLQPDPRAADRAQIALDILRQPQREANAAVIRQGFREGNMARSMFEGQSAAARAATDTEWTNAAKSALGETGGKTPALPGEKPLLSPQQRAASSPADFSPGSRWKEAGTGLVFEVTDQPVPAGNVSVNVIRPQSSGDYTGPAFITLENLHTGHFVKEGPLASRAAETGHQALYEASLRQHEQEIRNLIQQAKLPPEQLADLQWELKERGAQFAQRALDMGESPGIAKEVAALEQRDVLRSKLAAKDQAALDAMERDHQARQAAADAQAAKEGARTQREHIDEVIQQGKIEMSAADRAQNDRTAANIKAGREAANLNADAAKVEALHERVKESLLYSGYDNLGTAAVRANKGALRTAEVEQIAQDAHAHGIDMADVQRIGDGYTRILDSLGQHMVDMGLMKPEAYQALKGQYLPRLYLMTKGNPGDVDQFLKFLDSNGMLTPEARAEAAQRGLVGRFQTPSGLRSFEKSRKLTDFDQMNDAELARARVPEATPAALHGIEAQSRAAGLADAHAEIAKNPEWAVPAEQAPLGWKVVAQKGPLAGMAVHPAVAEVLQEATSPNRWRQAAIPLLGEKGANLAVNVQQGIRKLMLSSPSTMANVAVGHYWFAASEAAQNGTRFGLPEYAAAMRDLHALGKTGRSADPYLNEALNRTDILGNSAGLLPKAAKRVSGGVGLETPLQNVARGARKVGNSYLNATHDVLAGGKFGLYRQLRKAGKSIDEAARLTRKATINYTRVPRAIRFLDQGLIAPFLTFPFRAAPLAARMAVRRPDIFATASGHRFTYYLDQMADQLALSRGQHPQAGEDRRSGKVSPLTFPVPGQMDAHGRQIYKTAPLAAPLLHHFGSGNDLTEPLARYAMGASPWMIPKEIANNVDLRNEENRPIVPKGLPPGGPQANIARFRWLASAIAPPLGGIIQGVDAARGVTSYAQAGKKPQPLGSAVEQYFTGTRTGTANDLKPAAEEPPGATVRGSARHEEVLQNIRTGGGEHYGQLAQDYLQHLFSQHRDPNFTPNRKYAETARDLSDGKLMSTLEDVQKSLRANIYGQQTSGADREATIRRVLDWGYTLLREAERRKMAAPYKKFAGSTLFPLAELKREAP